VPPSAPTITLEGYTMPDRKILLPVDEIHAVSDKLASLNADIHAMPAWKKQTAYGLDRLAERQRLLLKLDRLRSGREA